MINAKVTVETIGAIIDGNPIGSTIEIDGRSAKALEAIGYVRILQITVPTPAPVKKVSAPKKPEAKAKVKLKSTTKSTKDN